MVKKDIRSIVGSCHVNGGHHFTDQDILNEGADRLLELGTKVIKVWFLPRPEMYYRTNSTWPKVTSLVELANVEHYRRLFDKPFETFLLETFRAGIPDHYYTEGMTSLQEEEERQALYEIARHFLTAYKGTGKTFIFQNWESDWVLTDPQFTKEPDPVAIKGMIKWLNARQDGVNRAREEIGMDGVTVAHAAEVNLIARAIDGHVTATTHVLPHTNCDLYSYSSYETSVFMPDRLKEVLSYLREHTPESAIYGRDNIYIGEFGAPENEFDQRAIVKQNVEDALAWGVRYMLYWEVYDGPNEGHTGPMTNADCRGFWLIRPDGTKAPAWEYFEELFAGA